MGEQRRGEHQTVGPMRVKPGRIAEAEERRKQVSALLTAGVPYRVIAEQLGVVPSTICEDVKRILERLREQQVVYGKRYQSLQLARLERINAANWRKAVEGDEKAGELCLKVHDRISRLLGLDAPQRQEVTGYGGGPVQVAGVPDDLIRRLVPEFAGSGENGAAGSADTGATGPAAD